MYPTPQLEACIAHMTPEQYARLLAFAQSLLADSAVQSAHNTIPPDVEAAAVQQRFEDSFPDSLRRRLRLLTYKSEAETLSPQEREEYLALAEQREQADAERLQAVIQLARLRGIPPTQLLAEWGIGTPEHA